MLFGIIAGNALVKALVSRQRKKRWGANGLAMKNAYKDRLLFLARSAWFHRMSVALISPTELTFDLTRQV